MKLMFTFQSHENSKYQYFANVIRDDDNLVFKKPCYFWFGDADNDVDGSPYWNDDKYGQADTRWHYDHAPINGDLIPFIVVPPQIIAMTPEIVGGCLASVECTGVVVPAVVGDSGPSTKLGEMSPAALRGLGLPAPTDGSGGLDTQDILYRIWPGTPAVLGINSKIYRFELQPA